MSSKTIVTYVPATFAPRDACKKQNQISPFRSADYDIISTCLMQSLCTLDQKKCLSVYFRSDLSPTSLRLAPDNLTVNLLLQCYKLIDEDSY